jgi:hypothetical protein
MEHIVYYTISGDIFGETVNDPNTWFGEKLTINIIIYQKIFSARIDILSMVQIHDLGYKL